MVVPEKLLRVKRVAELLDVTPEHVYRMVQDGLLPAIRVGRQWRFSENRLLNWMQQGGAGDWRRRTCLGAGNLQTGSTPVHDSRGGKTDNFA